MGKANEEDGRRPDQRTPLRPCVAFARCDCDRTAMPEHQQNTRVVRGCFRPGVATERQNTRVVVLDRTDRHAAERTRGLPPKIPSLDSLSSQTHGLIREMYMDSPRAKSGGGRPKHSRVFEVAVIFLAAVCGIVARSHRYFLLWASS